MGEDGVGKGNRQGSLEERIKTNIVFWESDRADEGALSLFFSVFIPCYYRGKGEGFAFFPCKSSGVSIYCS